MQAKSPIIKPSQTKHSSKDLKTVPVPVHLISINSVLEFKDIHKINPTEFNNR